MKLLRSESYKSGIVLSVGLNVIAKSLGFINSIAIAFHFGAQLKTDIYFYCFAAVGVLIGFIGSLDNSVIIPESMRMREQEGEEMAKHFLNYFLYLYAGIGLLVVFILMLDPVRFLGLVSNFDPVGLKGNKDLVFWFIPICLLMLITNYLTNVLSSYKYFIAPILAAVINNVFSVLFLLTFHKVLDVKSIVLGLSIGYLVNISLLLLIMKSQLRWRFGVKRILFDQRLKRNIRYALLGNITSFFAGYAPFYVMSNFNPGVVTMFNYAKSLSEIPSQMITTQFSAVSAIRFNELAAKGKWNELDKSFLQMTGVMIFVMAPVSAILFLFSEEIIAMLYQRGEFDAKAVGQTAFILKYLSFSVIYFVINTIISRLFMATQKIKESFWFQIYMNLFFILVIGLLSFTYGMQGYLTGTLLYQSIVVVFSYWLMKKQFRYINYLQVLKELVKNIVLNLALTVGFYYLLKNKESGYFLTTTGIVSYFLVVLLVNQGFRVNHIANQYFKHIFGKIYAITSIALYRGKA